MHLVWEGAEAGADVDELWYWSARKRGVVATARIATFLLPGPPSHLGSFSTLSAVLAYEVAILQRIHCPISASSAPLQYHPSPE